MKKVWDKWTRIALVKRILVGLILGAILGIAVPQATGIAILGDVFVSALKAIAALLVFFLVVSSLCNAGKSHGGVIKTVIILYMFSTVLAAVIAVFASMAFPVKMTLANAATDTSAPQGIVEVLNNLLLNVVANPVSSLVNANYVGILMWAVLLGLAFRAADKMTKKVLADVADGISMVVTWIINLAPFGIFGLVFNTVSTNGLDIYDLWKTVDSSCRMYAVYLFCDQSASGLLVHPPESISADFPLPEEKCADSFLYKKFRS